MISITDASKCCGCTACYASCPYGAITMKPDRLGFLYPEVDMSRCVDCRICESVCDFVRTSDMERSLPQVIPVIAARNKEAAVLESSQSGGVFSSLAKAVMTEGGTVYGAAYNQDFTVSHHRSETLAGCKAFRGSKYVQSEMGDIFLQVRKDLEEGRKVLFSGTPCQVAGLLAFVPTKLQSGLVTVDFICHGVPSPYVWRDYLDYMKRKGNLVSAVFRDKSAGGWKVHVESFGYANGKHVFRETYRVLFYKNVMLRHSCSVCPYDYSRRKADVTIADFWGVDEMLPHLDGSQGTSMVIPMTEKGRDLVSAVLPDLAAEKANLPVEFISRRNPNLLRPSKICHERQMFEDIYPEKGFLYAARRWGDMGWRYKAWQLKVFVRKMFSKR